MYLSLVSYYLFHTKHCPQRPVPVRGGGETKPHTQSELQTVLDLRSSGDYHSGQYKQQGVLLCSVM
jgi:hypothetical protein